MASLKIAAKSCIEAFETFSHASITAPHAIDPEDINCESMRFANWCATHNVFVDSESSLDHVLKERSDLRGAVGTAIQDIVTILQKLEILITQYEGASIRSSRSSGRTVPQSQRRRPASSSSRGSSDSLEDLDQEVTLLDRLRFEIDGLLSLDTWLAKERFRGHKRAVWTGSVPMDTDIVLQSQALVSYFARSLGDRLPPVLLDRYVTVSARRQSHVHYLRGLQVGATKRSDVSLKALNEEIVSSMARSTAETESFLAACSSAGAGMLKCRLCGERIAVGTADSRDVHTVYARRHLLAHLEPYCCTYEECTASGDTYSSIRAWKEHESHVHRSQWRCPECEPAFCLDEASELEEHLRSGHHELYCEADIAAIISYTRCGRSEERTQCMFCGAPCAPQQFADHVATHFEALAGLALHDLTPLASEGQFASGAEAFARMQIADEKSSHSQAAHIVKSPHPTVFRSRISDPDEPSFKKRPRTFFKWGMVFRVKNASERRGNASGAASVISDGTERVTGKAKTGAPLVEQIRWYIVIEEGETSCRCLTFRTNKGRGTRDLPREKKRSDFSVVYSDRAPPDLALEERQSRERPEAMRRAIRVEATDPTEKIDHMSRLDWSEIPVVEHNVMARKFGRIDADFEHVLVSEFAAVNPKSSVQFRRPTHFYSLGADTEGGIPATSAGLQTERNPLASWTAHAASLSTAVRGQEGLLDDQGPDSSSKYSNGQEVLLTVDQGRIVPSQGPERRKCKISNTVWKDGVWKHQLIDVRTNALYSQGMWFEEDIWMRPVGRQ